MRYLAALSAAALLVAGCGGGGGGGAPPPQFEVLSVGLVRADVASNVSVLVTNPLPDSATVEEVDPPVGAFAFAAAALPGAVVQGGSFRIQLVFTPPGPGDHTSEFRVRFKGAGGGVQDVIVTVRATVETTAAQLVTPSLDFGTVLVGDEKGLSISLRNPNQLTPIQVTAVTGSLPADFRLVTSALPRLVAPGQVFSATLVFAPTGLGTHSFQLFVEHSESGFPFPVSVAADAPTWKQEMITDFGEVPVVNGETDWLEMEVPPHGVSLSIEAVGPEDSVPGLLGLEGPGGRVYENDTATGEYLWSPGDGGVLAQTVPNSDRAEVQLVDGGGTYRFRFYMFAGTASSLAVRAIVHNRPAAILNSGELDLNVFLSPSVVQTQADQTRLDLILAGADAIFQQRGLRLGSVSVFQLTDIAYDSVLDLTTFEQLLKESSIGFEKRLNLFFVQTALGNGVLGVAARVPGPALNGTPVSGVMVDFDFGSATTGAHVTAHEIGHYLGLFHTAEENGGHDIIDDTLECPGSGTNSTCPTEGGGYLMHWRVVDADPPIITAGQGLVMLAHPLVSEPLALGAAPLRLAPPPAGALDALPDGWCGTPGCRAK